MCHSTTSCCRRRHLCAGDVTRPLPTRCDKQLSGTWQYSFAARAQNKGGWGATRTATASPVAAGGNSFPPMVNAGPEQTAWIGATVTLDRSRTNDVDLAHLPQEETDRLRREALHYRRTRVRVTLDDATAIQPTVSAPDRPLELESELTVSDGDSAKRSSGVSEGNARVTIRVRYPWGTPGCGPTRQVSMALQVGAAAAALRIAAGHLLNQTFNLQIKKTGEAGNVVREVLA